MMGRAFSSDLLKIRRKGLWLLAIVAPLGLLAMQALNFGLRYDYFLEQYEDELWEQLLQYMTYFVSMSVLLGCTLVSSLLANVEHGTSSWKQLLALPISRSSVFAAKFALSALLMAFSCVLLAIGTVVFGLSFGFPLSSMPLWDIVRLSFFPYLGAMPFLAFLLSMCIMMRNQAMLITIGVTITIVSLFSTSAPEWLPLNWPLFAYLSDKPFWFAAAGIVTGAAVALMGMIRFERKDVA
ncbi:ABC transporter permease [Cohnella thailandensis]|uniref:ABC transporter permease n=1 Tax=Cohnella thailandensis TaxID=557557 RepID=A0A841SZ59_9BACL|nr:ABC transporter permease [Cohnella thailandensis]MBB6634061.1 ABC transporter permease [Cohnella thailandensis]MBP1972447.1 hypothetical protein [Cohnella thailandensis]